MSATLTPTPVQQFFDANGIPLVGGKLYSYAAGTSTPQDTYTDASGTITNTNPVILNARGECQVWLNGIYKLVLKDSTDTLIWSVDSILGTGNALIPQTIISAYDGQTTIPLTFSYTVGGNSILVFKNGVKLTIPDYAETTATSITLALGATVGDEIVVIGWAVGSVTSDLAAPGAIGETTPGTIRGLNKEIFKTDSADSPLTAAEASGTIVSNYGMTDADCVISLPTAAAGYAFVCILPAVRARYFKFKAGATDKIYLSGTAGSDNGYVGVASGYATGASCSVSSFKASDGGYDWFVLPLFGTWVAS